MLLSGVSVVIFYFVLREIRYSNENLNRRRGFLWSLFILFAVMLSWLGFLAGLFHCGILARVNRLLSSFIALILNNNIRSAYSVFSRVKENVVLDSLMAGFLTFGIAVLSFAPQRPAEKLNPYPFKEHVNVLQYLALLLCATETYIYMHSVRLGALDCLSTIITVTMCLAVPVYFYLLHTPAQIQISMAIRLKKALKESLKSNKTDDLPTFETLKPVFKHTICWHKTLINGREEIELRENASHHFYAYKWFFKVNKDFRVNWTPILYFALGYFAMYPSLEIKDDEHAVYFKHFLSTISREEEKNAHFISGVLFARLRQKLDLDILNYNTNTNGLIDTLKDSIQKWLSDEYVSATGDNEESKTWFKYHFWWCLSNYFIGHRISKKQVSEYLNLFRKYGINCEAGQRKSEFSVQNTVESNESVLKEFGGNEADWLSEMLKFQMVKNPPLYITPQSQEVAISILENSYHGQYPNTDRTLAFDREEAVK